MHSYVLSPHVSFGLLDDVPVFLDLRADRYFKGNPATAATLARASRGTSTDEDQTTLERLVAAGVLARSREVRKIHGTSPFIPPKSVLDGLASNPSIVEVVAVWRQVARIRLQLKRNGLQQIVAGFARAKEGGTEPPAAQEKTHHAAARFVAARRLVPLRPNCLSDSLALASWLARRSLFPDLVFGVKLHPFAAHCWLQTRNEVLNDDAESVAAFVPVLAV